MLSFNLINAGVPSTQFRNSSLWHNKRQQKKTPIDSFLLNCKGLAKLGNIVVETLLQTQMFSSLAVRETCVAEANFAS